jgi:hypothetical protein
MSYLCTLTYEMFLRVLKSFALENRSFYFLTNDDRIAGLISIVNFNCRQVKTYLFSLISEFEVRLGEFLVKHFTEEEMIKLAFANAQHRDSKRMRAIFENDRASGVDVPLVEYLFLWQLLDIFVAKQMYGVFDCDSKEQFAEKFSPIKRLRNQVTHPIKSLITEPGSCRKLWDTVDAIEEALFKLRHLD